MRSDPWHPVYILEGREWTVLLSVFDDAGRQPGADPGQRLELADISAVQIHATEPFHVDRAQSRDGPSGWRRPAGTQPRLDPVTDAPEKKEKDDKANEPLFALGRRENLEAQVENRAWMPAWRQRAS